MPTITQRQIHFVPDGQSLSSSAAETVICAIEKAIARRGVAAISLCSGPTTRKLFAMLADEPYASRLRPLWTRLHVFWTSERHVRPDHPESSYRLAHGVLLSRYAIPSTNIHRIRAEMADGVAVAAAYQHDLRTFFQPRGLMRDGLPCFDLVILALDDRNELPSVRTLEEPQPAEASEDLIPVRARGESESGGAHDEEPQIWVALRASAAAERADIGLTLPILRNARNSLVLFRSDAVAAGRAAHILRFVA